MKRILFSFRYSNRIQLILTSLGKPGSQYEVVPLDPNPGATAALSQGSKKTVFQVKHLFGIDNELLELASRSLAGT